MKSGIGPFASTSLMAKYPSGNPPALRASAIAEIQRW
jgi:hypothetical protein